LSYAGALDIKLLNIGSSVSKKVYQKPNQSASLILFSRLYSKP